MKQCCKQTITHVAAAMKGEVYAAIRLVCLWTKQWDSCFALSFRARMEPVQYELSSFLSSQVSAHHISGVKNGKFKTFTWLVLSDSKHFYPRNNGYSLVLHLLDFTLYVL